MNEKRSMAWVWLLAAGCVCAGGCGFLWHRTEQVRLLAGPARPAPQPIKVADLLASGPGGNIHVALTDFRFAEGEVVVKKKPNGNRYLGAELPVYPKGKAKRDPAAPIVLVSAPLSTPGEVKAFLKKERVSGVITNATKRGDGELKPVEWRPPGGPPRQVWWVEVGQPVLRQDTVRQMERVTWLSGPGALVCLGLSAALGLIGRR